MSSDIEDFRQWLSLFKDGPCQIISSEFNKRFPRRTDADNAYVYVVGVDVISGPDALTVLKKMEPTFADPFCMILYQYEIKEGEKRFQVAKDDSEK